MTKPRNRFKGIDGKMQAPDARGSVTFSDIDDEFAKLDACRVRLNQGAAGAHICGQRELAPLLGRVSTRLRPVCQLLVPWRAGMRMRRAPLERAILDCLQALDELTAMWKRPVAEAERRTLERVLADLRSRRQTK